VHRADERQLDLGLVQDPAPCRAMDNDGPGGLQLAQHAERNSSVAPEAQRQRGRRRLELDRARRVQDLRWVADDEARVADGTRLRAELRHRSAEQPANDVRCAHAPFLACHVEHGRAKIELQEVGSSKDAHCGLKHMEIARPCVMEEQAHR
jgi:hypothetical protein